MNYELVKETVCYYKNFTLHLLGIIFKEHFAQNHTPLYHLISFYHFINIIISFQQNRIQLLPEY